MNGLNQYAEAGQVCTPKRQTLRERLVEQQRVAKEHLENINQALEFMDKNKDFESFHNIISRAGF